MKGHLTHGLHGKSGGDGAPATLLHVKRNRKLGCRRKKRWGEMQARAFRGFLPRKANPRGLYQATVIANPPTLPKLHIQAAILQGCIRTAEAKQGTVSITKCA